MDLVEQTRCKGHAHLVDLLRDIEGKGGEGSVRSFTEQGCKLIGSVG